MAVFSIVINPINVNAASATYQVKDYSEILSTWTHDSMIDQLHTTYTWNTNWDNHHYVLFQDASVSVNDYVLWAYTPDHAMFVSYNTTGYLCVNNGDSKTYGMTFSSTGIYARADPGNNCLDLSLSTTYLIDTGEVPYLQSGTWGGLNPWQWDEIVITPPEPPVYADIDYIVVNDEMKFTVRNEEEYDAVHWLISYGSIEGNPQLEVWESFDRDDKTTFNFKLPYRAKHDEADVWGTYSIQAVLVDENDEPLSSATSMLYTYKEGYINKYEGNCISDYCEVTPIDDNRISMDVFENCTWSAEFPYLNVENCSTGIKAILGTFDIRSTAIGANFDNMLQNNGCHTYYIFDDWLGLPTNYEVCAYIPSAIRTVVTPFVIFGLGLIGLNIVMKRREDNE